MDLFAGGLNGTTHAVVESEANVEIKFYKLIRKFVKIFLIAAWFWKNAFEEDNIASKYHQNRFIAPLISNLFDWRICMKSHSKILFLQETCR